MGKSHLYITALAIVLAGILNLSEVFSQGILQTTPSNLSLTSDTDSIAWGERAEITLRLGKGINETMEGWPQWQDTIPGGLEILETSLIDTLAPQNSDPDEWDMIMEQSWVVTGWDSGYVLIPSIKLGGASTSPVLLQIVPSRTEGAVKKSCPPQTLFKLNGVAYERFIKAAPWIGGIIGLVILLFIAKFVYLWWRNRAAGGRTHRGNQALYTTAYYGYERIENPRRQAILEQRGSKDFSCAVESDYPHVYRWTVSSIIFGKNDPRSL